MGLSEEARQKADALGVEVLTEVYRFQNDISFLDIEIDGLDQLAKGISNHINNSPNLLGEEIDWWSDRAQTYRFLMMRALKEKNTKLNLMLKMIQNLTLEFEKLGAEIPKEISDVSTDIENYDFNN